MTNPFDDDEVLASPEDEADEEPAPVDLPQHVLDIIERFQGKHGDIEDESIIIKTKTEVTVWSSIGSDICKTLNRVGSTAKVSADGYGVYITVDKASFRGIHSAFRTGKRRVMSDEQKAAAALRLSEARARKSA